MKTLVLLIHFIFVSVTYAQESGQNELQKYADDHQLPIDRFHSTLYRNNKETEQVFNNLLNTMAHLPENEVKKFYQLISDFGQETGAKVVFSDPVKMLQIINDPEAPATGNGIEATINGQSHKLSKKMATKVFGMQVMFFANKGNIKSIKAPTPPMPKPEPVVAISPPEKVETKPKIDCKAELTASLDGFLKENRDDFLKAQFRITSLKLAQKTRDSNKNTIEEILKTEKDNLTQIKNADESKEKLKELYRQFGFADDSKAISEIEKLTNRAATSNYYKPSQRLLNEDLSAYLMANVADKNNKLFDESDVATAWLFDEMQKKYTAMGNKKFGQEFNLMNLSSASYLYTNSVDENGKKIDIAEALSSSEKVFSNSYNDFLIKFKDQKKECFEDGAEWSGQCDTDVLALIEKGFQDDLGKLIAGMRSDSIKPEFTVNHLKIADSEIDFTDLMSFDVSKASMPALKTPAKSSAPTVKRDIAREQKAPHKEVSANDFKAALRNSLKPSAPFLPQGNFSKTFHGEIVTTKIGICEMVIKRLPTGKTRVEMFSPKNQISYNITLNTKLYYLGDNNLPMNEIIASYDHHYNKPHIRNSCLAN